MRIAAVEKMGYYPLPPVTTQRIAAALRVDRGAQPTLLDPCAGQGEALAAFKSALANQGAHPHTYGIELSPGRAEIAKDYLGNVICASYEDVTMSRFAWSLMLLNPPYDTQTGNVDDAKPRLEYTFLRNTFMRLQNGGLLIYVVPVDILRKSNVRRSLAAYFDNLQVFKCPAEEYDAFRQIIITGHVRDKAIRDEQMELTLENYCFNPSTINELPLPTDGTSADWSLFVPTTLKRPQDIQFFKPVLSPQEIIAATAKHSALASPRWLRLTELDDETAFRPVVPLKIGHLGSLIASGQMGTVTLTDTHTDTQTADGSDRRLIAKGYATKTLAHFDKDGIQYDPAKLTPEEALQRADTQREVISTSVFTLDQHGHHEHINTTDKMQTFLDKYAGQIAHIVQHAYTPLYVEPTPEEWQKLAGLMKGRKLPGRKATGLLPAQKHVAIAAARSARHQGWADLIGEMGTGKSAMTLATLELLDAYPAIVICPGHITKKWAREVQDVAGADPFNIDSLADLVHFHRTWDRQKHPKPVLIISKERIKLGSGWQHATVQREQIYTYRDTITDEIRQARRIQHFCPRCGQPLVNKEGIPLPPKLPDRRLFCQAKRPKFSGDASGNNAYGEIDPDALCGAPLFEYKGFRRWPLATYISRKMKGFFQACVADEVHQFKAKSTDQAAAYHRIAQACKYVLNATGTYFGGKSTDIFWLRHKMDPWVRQRYHFGGELSWARDFGRLQFSVGAQDDDDSDEVETGKFSGQRRYNNRAKEIPGISPKIFGKLLKSAVFVKVADLGYQMPDYRETVVRLDMTDTQRHQYDFLHSTMMDDILACYESGDSDDKLRAAKLLSVWLQNTLSRPNSAFRPELVKWTHPRLKLHNEAQEIKYIADVQNGLAVTKPEPLTHAAYSVYNLPNFFLDPHKASNDEDASSDLANELEGLVDELFARPVSGASGESGTFGPSAQPDASGDDLPNPISCIPNPLHTFFDLTSFEEQLAEQEQLLADIAESHKMPLALYPVIERPDILLPKEEWLVDYVTAEKKAGRKVIVFIRQTGTRDIQPRIQKLLQDTGLRTQILPASLAPAKREKWIDTHVGSMDVLIVNPIKVETGMDLVRFSTAIFYELSYSLYTLWQAMRRVWRLGQTQDVKVLFPVYRGTMEESALALMGAKMQAALMLYGDNAASAITEESQDGGDFLAELAHKMLAGEDLSLDGITGLLGDAAATEAEAVFQDAGWEAVEDEEANVEEIQPPVKDHPTKDHPTKNHPTTRPIEQPINLFQQWLQQYAPQGLEEKPRPRRRKEKDIPDSQLTLF